MAREKQGYREILSMLMEQYPATKTRLMAAEILNVSPKHLRKIIKKGISKFKTVRSPSAV